MKYVQEARTKGEVWRRIIVYYPTMVLQERFNNDSGCTGAASVAWPRLRGYISSYHSYGVPWRKSGDGENFDNK